MAYELLIWGGKCRVGLQACSSVLYHPLTIAQWLPEQLSHRINSNHIHTQKRKEVYFIVMWERMLPCALPQPGNTVFHKAMWIHITSYKYSSKLKACALSKTHLWSLILYMRSLQV